MTRPTGPRILFVVDAGPRIGGGHVMRSLNLARALEASAARCVFSGPPAMDQLLDTFAPDLPRAGGVDATAEGCDAVVFDHYGLGAADHRRIAAGRPTLVVDDLADRPLAADLVLDAGVARRATDYDGLLAPGAELLLGPAYAALAPAFADLREASLARRAAAPTVQRVLVSLGLTDVGAITGRVVRALLAAPGDWSLDVVVGGAAPSLPALREIADPRLRLHVDSRDMARLTASADLAVGAAGSSSWERCVLGLPTVSLVLADNQRQAARALADLGAQISLEGGASDDVLRAAFTALAGDAAARCAMSIAAAAVCDGRGAARAAERFLARIAAR